MSPSDTPDDVVKLHTVTFPDKEKQAVLSAIWIVLHGTHSAEVRQKIGYLIPDELVLMQAESRLNFASVTEEAGK